MTVRYVNPMLKTRATWCVKFGVLCKAMGLNKNHLVKQGREKSTVLSSETHLLVEVGQAAKDIEEINKKIRKKNKKIALSTGVDRRQEF